MQSERVWWVTGAAAGLGRAVADEVLARGQRVVAFARNASRLAEWVAASGGRAVALELDMDDTRAIERASAQALVHFGRVDVLCNNAGYGILGAVEEVSDSEARAQMETNFFGALTMTRCALAAMRPRRYGRILQVSSVAGFHASVGFGLYNASKFALEGFSEALALEAAHLGIRVVIVEPGPYRTGFAGAALRRAQTRVPDYNASVGTMEQRMASLHGSQPGDPLKAARVMVDVAELAEPPLRLPLGRYAHERLAQKIAWLSRDAEALKATSLPTEFGD
jgi:NAD(P)-dependent dehydrogenase (short-subunit alcohol dehydrogenase family)